jgi:hypothetical protein
VQNNRIRICRLDRTTFDRDSAGCSVAIIESGICLVKALLKKRPVGLLCIPANPKSFPTSVVDLGSMSL